MPFKQSFSVSTINELVKYNNAHTEIIFVDDNVRTSGNPFRWAGNTLKANGGTTHPGLGGVWEMMFDGPVNVNWFGALSNGKNVTKEFQLAIDFAHQRGKSVYVPGYEEVNYYQLGQINLYDNSIVYGDYRRTVIVPADHAVKKIFNIEGKSYSKEVKTYNNIYRLTILNQVKNGPITVECTALHFKYCDEVHLSELIIDGFDINMNIEDSNSIYGRDIRARGASRNNVKISFHQPAVPFIGSWVSMSGCEFNGGNFSHAGREEKFSVYIENMSSVTFDKCIIAGNAGGGIKFSQTYLKPASKIDMGFVVITGCDIDSNHGSGIRGEYARNCVIKGNWISSGREQKASGIDLFNCESCSVTDNQCFYNGSNGLLITNCKYLSVSNNICTNNGEGKSTNGCGIKCVKSTYNTFTSNICIAKKYDWPNGNQIFGISSDEGSDYNVFSSNIVTSNNKPLQLQGKNNTSTNNIIDNI
ncbi:right-handed parallel beta-helix repeat-containing protein [Segetibacter aerophilus]|uniref:Right handed beta helix domain-containing protein n=1 Tax=Segetibacter aerophilus TaxID=670293 RepID=A0A512BI10_9BACT|nr:right-handed parallel beta-helix repeat-containing protein [Segetibacter aerophilus]GEO11624.1 hypothetical protein SAE01_41200 [Segetibacter aerophilus]